MKKTILNKHANKKTLIEIICLIMLFILTGCTNFETNKSISLSIDADTDYLYVGEKYTLNLAFSDDLVEDVTFLVEDTSVCHITESTLYCDSTGETIITVYLNSDNEKRSNVTIKVVEKQIEPTDIIIDINNKYEVGTVIIIDPIVIPEASKYSLEIKSSDESIGSLDENTLTLNKTGTFNITISVIGFELNKTITIEVINRTPESVTHNIDTSEFTVGDTKELEINFFPAGSYCETVTEVIGASIEGKTITFDKVGECTIIIKTLDGVILTSKQVTVKEKLPESITINLSEKYQLNDKIILSTNVENKIIWDISPSDMGVIENGIVTFTKEGTVTIKAFLEEDQTVYSTKEIEIASGALEYIVSKDLSETIVVNQKVYTRNVNAFSSFTEAQEYIKNTGAKANVLMIDDVVDYDINISISNINLYGVNKNISFAEERKTEILMKGIIRVLDGVTDIEINGFNLTEKSQIILEGNNKNINILYNDIYNTNSSATSWTETKDYTSGIIELKYQSNNSDNIIIEGNSFRNIDNVGINYSSVNNIRIINNLFENFEKDAIRSNNGMPSKTCQWFIKDNIFINGTYNGIMFRTYGGSGITYEHIISIYDNTFTNIGKANELYANAISFRNYQEGLTSVNISYNEFTDCQNYILLRNNADANNQANFSGYVTYNAFIGLPSKYYFLNKNNSDTSSTNPSQTILSNNYYGESFDKKIDVSQITSMFIGNASNKNIFDRYIELECAPKIYGKSNAYLESTSNLISSIEVSWESMNPDIATIDSKGIITPHKLGVVTIKGKTSLSVTSFEIVVKEAINIDYIKKIIETALSQEGYKEGANNATKFGEWYGLPNSAWCAMFVSWCANQSNIGTSIIPKYASVSTGMKWFQDRNLFQYKENYIPKAGDIIFFKSDGASHTGIVMSCDGEKVYTIEGNTSDMVAKRSYTLLHSKITGYGLPQYPEYDGETFVFDVTGATDGSKESTT